MTQSEWQNWSGSVSCTPSRIEQPRSEEEIREAVGAAKARGQRIRVVGSGHSFVPLCSTDDLLISLDRLQGLVSTDPVQKLATVWSGSKIYQLGEPLLKAGLAMINMGDIDRQSIAGAISTGTHGTGPTLGSISTQVQACRIVRADGSILEVDREVDKELWQAAALSMGSLGVLSCVTLRVLPAYRLHEQSWIEPFDECVQHLNEHVQSTRHFEFFWVPEYDVCACKALHPTEMTEVPLSTRAKERTGPLARYVNEDRIDASHRIFPSERNRRFNEIEFAVAAETGVECLAELRNLMKSQYSDVVWPIEYRTLAADELFLSPAYQRSTVTISLHQAAALPYEHFFADVETIFRNFGGRPHWGKIHTHSCQELEELYPAWVQFHQIRHQHDPEEYFMNEYLERIFGLFSKKQMNQEPTNAEVSGKIEIAETPNHAEAEVLEVQEDSIDKGASANLSAERTEETQAGEGVNDSGPKRTQRPKRAKKRHSTEAKPKVEEPVEERPEDEEHPEDVVIPDEPLPPVELDDLPDLLRTAAGNAGWTTLMPVQSQAIPYLLAKRDLMVQSRTGSGKTGAFLLPIFERVNTKQMSCQALVLVPTRELAQQVAKEAALLGADSGIQSVAVYGGVKYGPQIDALKKGGHLVIGTPGRILDHLLRRTLRLDKLKMLVLDEADRMLSMGFYPDMREVQSYLPSRSIHVCMFSATFPTSVLRLAKEFLSEPEFLSLSKDRVHVADADHVYFMVPSVKKDRSLIRLIEVENPASAIIFCNTKNTVHYVTVVLQRFGYDADEISSDLTQKDRDRVLNRVREGKLRFLVATDVAARGIDIPDLSHVFQYEPPEDPESYIHRAGRTARAGATGVAISLIENISERLQLDRIAKRFGIEMQERELPSDEEVTATVSERVTTLLEAKLRERDKLHTERMQRFVPQVVEWTESEEGRALLAMLVDDFYQESLHMPLLPPEERSSQQPKSRRGRSRPDRSNKERTQYRRSGSPKRSAVGKRQASGRRRSSRRRRDAN